MFLRPCTLFGDFFGSLGYIKVLQAPRKTKENEKYEYEFSYASLNKYILHMYQGLLVENQFGQNLHGKHPVSHFHQSDDTFMIKFK